MKIDGTFQRSFIIGRLYWKYIRGTELEVEGVTDMELARLLHRTGLIHISECGLRYTEAVKFHPYRERSRFLRIWKDLVAYEKVI